MSPIFRPDMAAIAIATVTTPIPPIWIRTRMMRCPKNDQYVAVSWTTSPVTQVAEVAVNSVSMNGVETRCCVAHGSMSSSAPVMITVKNPMIITWLEVKCLLGFRFVVSSFRSCLKFMCSGDVLVFLPSCHLAVICHRSYGSFQYPWCVKSRFPQVSACCFRIVRQPVSGHVFMMSRVQNVFFCKKNAF